MARQTLIDSIEALKDEDFSVGSGFKTDIYLDPEAEKIYTFVGSNSQPMTAYHRIDRRIVTANSSAIPASVYSAIKSLEDNLDLLIDQYEGSEWNGNNHVGQWSESAEDTLESIWDQQLEIASYWDASDWFEPVTDQLKDAWENGQTAEQIIDEQGCGNEADGMCDRDEAITWLESKIEEWQAEAEEESA